MKRMLLAITMVTLCSCHERGWHAHEASQHFANADDWAQRFDDPARDDWQKPDQVLEALALTSTMKVADVGAATGYFSVRLARRVPQGHVYGVDIESSMVEYLAKRAEKEGLANLSTVLAAPADAKLPEPVDLVLIVNTWHHVGDRVAYFTTLRRSLNPGGRLAIIDFTRQSHMGPPASAKSDASQVTAELGEAGFKLDQTLTFLPEQFFLIYSPR